MILEKMDGKHITVIITRYFKIIALGASLIAPILFYFSFTYSQEILWEKRIDIGRRDYINNFIVFPDRNIGIVGVFIDSIPNIFLYKISPNGDSIFLKSSSQKCFDIWPTGALIDDEENIYLVGLGETIGVIPSDTIRFGFIAKFSGQGEFIFRKNFYYGRLAEFLDITFLNNSIFVCGRVVPNYPTGSEYGILLKYDKEGNLLWQRLFNHHCFEGIENMDGYLYITGTLTRTIPPLGFRISFIKADTLGDTLIVRGDIEASGGEIALDSFGNILIAGNGPYPDLGIRLLKYDQNGDLNWYRIYFYGNWDWPTCMEVNPYGEIFLGNFLEVLNPLTHKWQLIKYNSMGEMMWQHIYSLPDSLVVIEALTIVNRNEIIAGGVSSTRDLNFSNGIVIKYLDNSNIKEDTFHYKPITNKFLTQIYDITGKRVYKDINKLRKGVYILEIDKRKKKLIIIK
ncbi:MAG: hypothetical protein ABIK40_05825 [candidate division WOR-3 bacterium]